MSKLNNKFVVIKLINIITEYRNEVDDFRVDCIVFGGLEINDYRQLSYLFKRFVASPFASIYSFPHLRHFNFLKFLPFRTSRKRERYAGVGTYQYFSISDFSLHDCLKKAGTFSAFFACAILSFIALLLWDKGWKDVVCKQERRGFFNLDKGIPDIRTIYPI
ncbi:hypothetical protein RIR_jg32158.t1 [Rhizophagus irregularis DAOM 181602=DAOM 197198]|nr:hypothetical protein RIR_jg32158.t1 [Rhizophagus irregularis DAOM 181602=DAOM 197198]